MVFILIPKEKDSLPRLEYLQCPYQLECIKTTEKGNNICNGKMGYPDVTGLALNSYLCLVITDTKV